MKRVTIQDIAKKLELSRNTVAKALNGGKVSNAVKMTVLQKAYEMGYEKLDQAMIEEAKKISSINMGGTILVVNKRVNSNFWNKILAGISDELNENGYRMQLYIIEKEDTDAIESIRNLVKDVKGIILLSYLKTDLMEVFAAGKKPITMLGAPKKAEEYLQFGNIVAIEARYAISKIMRELIQRNKKTYAFVGGVSNYNFFMRYDAMRQTLNDYKIEVDERLMLTHEPIFRYYDLHAVERLLENIPYLPEVFVCTDDDIAESVATALMKKDREIAKKTIIVGFDNTINPNFFESEIITVKVNIEGLGRRLVTTMFESIIRPDLDHILVKIASFPVLEDKYE